MDSVVRAFMPILPTTRALLLMLIVLGILPRLASAQGTFGTLPPPISSADLERYADRLNLSDQQMLAIAEHHRAYLEQFRQLRDGEIERFLGDMQQMRRTFSVSRIADFGPMVREIDRLMRRIGTVDEQFFNQMQTVLTEEQVQSMPRLRQHRERRRYSGDLTRGLDFINPGVRIDLSEIIDELVLTSDELDAIDPHLAQYERRLTSQARTMWKASIKAVSDGVAEVAALGLDEEQMRQPAQMLRLFEEAERIWQEVAQDMLDEAAKLASLNRRTYESIARLLPADVRRTFHRHYLSRAYREASQLGVKCWVEVDKALSLDDLPVRLRETVEHMATNHEQQQQMRVKQIADLLDEYRVNLSVQQMMRRGEDETLQRVAEIREEGEEADERFLSSLAAMLGKEWSERVQAAPAPRSERRRASGSRRGGERQVAIEPRTTLDRPGMQWPERITTDEIDRLVSELQLNEAQSAAVQTRFREYTNDFNRARAAGMTAMRGLMAGEMDEAAPFDVVLDEVQLAEVVELTRSTMDELRDIEDAFFEEVHGLLASEAPGELVLAFEAARATRDRRLHLQATPELPHGNLGSAQQLAGNHAGGVDMRALLNELRWPDDARQRIEDAVADYEQQTQPLLRERFDADAVCSIYRWQYLLRSEDGRSSRADRWQVMRAWREQLRRSQQINRELAAHNQQLLAVALALAAPGDRFVLRDRYNRSAHPVIYDDPSSPEPKLLAAIQLENLTDRQRGRIEDLIAQFRLEYQQYCIEMVERVEQLLAIDFSERPGRGENREQFIERDELRNAIERIRFDREELNRQTLLRLRSIISEEQFDLLAHVRAPEGSLRLPRPIH